MQSRLAEVQGEGALVHEGDVELTSGGDGDSDALKPFFQQVDQLKECISYVQAKTKEIGRLQDAAVNAIKVQDERECSEKLDGILVDVQRKCEIGKELLATMEKDRVKLEAEGGQPSELRVRKQLENTLRQRFVSMWRSFTEAQNAYKDKLKEKVARQVRVVKPDATLEEIDTTMRSGDSGAIYRAAILQPGADPIKEAYAGVQAKYEDVLRLEESVRALNQMFKDMALLVEQQGEMLDQIEVQVDLAQNHVEQGTKHLQGALKARKSIRKKYMCIAMIVVIIAVVLVLAFLLKK